MKFGLKVHHTDIDQLLYLEPDAVEFALFPGDLDHREWADHVVTKVPIIVHAPEKYSNGVILDAGSIDEVQRASALETLKSTIDLAAYLKAEYVIIHPGGVFRDRRHTPAKSLVNTIAALKSYASNRVELLLENMPYYYRTRGELWHSCLFNRPQDIINILNQTELHMCLDICHAKLFCNVTGLSFRQVIKTLLPYAQHIHVSDAAGEAGEGLQICEGGIDWGQLLELTKDYNLIAVPEIDNGFIDKGKGFRIALERLSQMGFY
ncbi:MAG TPA: TIM barrel protein [Methanocella sp.]|nr:TIM barrel protein [Methanocella sp.]